MTASFEKNAGIFEREVDQSIVEQRGDHPRMGEPYKFLGALVIAKAIITGLQLVADAIRERGQ